MPDIEYGSYLSRTFGEDGVNAEITPEAWSGGWATIVGGMNGYPTAQQFNRVCGILSALVNYVSANLSTVKNTADAAMPQSALTAAVIHELLKGYGNLSGVDADTVDGKHASAFALAGHSHSVASLSGTVAVSDGGTGATTAAGARTNLGAAAASHTHTMSDVSGTLPVAKGGTGATTAAGALTNLGAMPLAGGTFTGRVNFANGTTYYVDANGNANFARVVGSVYNDYGELFPRGETTEPGDIIALDTESKEERYIRATQESRRVCGVHSDEYAYLIGGEAAESGEDYAEKNMKRFIPVGLAGRVRTKVVGVIRTGDWIVPSEIPGVGRTMNRNDSPAMAVGYAVESDDRTDVRRLRIRLGR